MTDYMRLPDFDLIFEDLQKHIRALDFSRPVDIDKWKLSKLVNHLNENKSRYDGVELIGGHTLIATNSSGQISYVSVQELPRLALAIPYYAALCEYIGAVDAALKIPRTSKSGEFYELFGKLPLLKGEQLTEDDTFLLERVLRDIQAYHKYTEERILRIHRFLTDAAWTRIRVNTAVGKRLNRGDFIESSVITQLQLVAASSSGRMPLIAAMRFVDISVDDFRHLSPYSPSALLPERRRGAENTIYFGAPGTGKTFAIDALAKEKGAHLVRTIFHAEMHSSDFIGGLKPSVNAENIVRYGFQPGPFAEAWRHAMNNPSEKVFLVIEELNRANAAAVIADLFLLLDRAPNGASQYSVDYPTEEFRVWAQQTITNCPETLSLPSNLWLYATINSSDQGVFHLDTAFRRRWRYVHMPIVYQEVSTDLVRVGSETFPWRTVLESVNEHLRLHLNLDEDRLIGPYFAQLALTSGGAAPSAIPDEILAYLWTDIFRHQSREGFFAPTVRSMGDLLDANRAGKPVFSPSFMVTLQNASSNES